MKFHTLDGLSHLLSNSYILTGKHRTKPLAIHDVLSIIFGLVALAGVIGGAINRYQLKKGIGAQFIRFIAVSVALPMSASLAFQGMLTEAVVTIITGALSYAFAGARKDEV